MRPIHLVRFDKVRPGVLLTRETSNERMAQVTVAPITSTVHEIPVEVLVGRRNGLDHNSVVNLDGITTMARGNVGRQIGWLFDDQEDALTRAIAYAFNLEIVEH